MHDSMKCQYLYQTFADAYRSPLSVIFIDDIERIIEYTPVGCRFSNSVLQTLLVLLRKPPPVENRRLFIIATTSISHLLQDLQLNVSIICVFVILNAEVCFCDRKLLT